MLLRSHVEQDATIALSFDCLALGKVGCRFPGKLQYEALTNVIHSVVQPRLDDLAKHSLILFGSMSDDVAATHAALS